jgi:hypothetical protein
LTVNDPPFSEKRERAYERERIREKERLKR